MLYPSDNYGFSAPVVSRSCVPALDNGITIGFALRLTAKHHRRALWVSLSTPTDGVAPLDKGTTIACEARLAVNADKPTEPVIIRWIEHYVS